MHKKQTLLIPEDYTEFFYWVKERTETSWSKSKSSNNTEGYPWPQCCIGVRGASFGLKHPGDNGETVQPIMPTYVPDEQDPSQKTFKGFD